MTMADTVAVMNAGKIEQMGAPTDIYDLPRTAFVANFLGQSNLLKGRATSSDGDNHVVTAYDQTFVVPKARTHAPGSSVIVGVRPEKLELRLASHADQVPAGHNRVSGRVTDASFTGVSTQYLVESPWGQELMVFEQNLAVGDRARTGDGVVLHWAPEHSFGLDGGEDIHAGVEAEVLEMEQAAAALVNTDTSAGG